VPTLALHNLGCSKNQIDGERMLGMLVRAGFSAVADFSLADVIIVNTCAFIREAQQEAIDAILEAGQFKKTGRCRLLAVAGCFSSASGMMRARASPKSICGSACTIGRNRFKPHCICQRPCRAGAFFFHPCHAIP